MFIRLFSYSFRDKKFDEKAHVLIPGYGKMLVIKFHIMVKMRNLLFS